MSLQKRNGVLCHLQLSTLGLNLRNPHAALKNSNFKAMKRSQKPQSRNDRKSTSKSNHKRECLFDLLEWVLQLSELLGIDEKTSPLLLLIIKTVRVFLKIIKR